VNARQSSHLILGGARSGKSRLALTLARSVPGRVAFVATAQPLDGEMAARIARHRADRPPEWSTVEEPLDPAGACRKLIGAADLVVVDCLTLWVSNRFLRGDLDAAILTGADELARLCRDRALGLILVSNEVGLGVHPATSSGLRFRDLLGLVNQRVAAAVDRVTLMVAGIPVAVKLDPGSEGLGPTEGPEAVRRERVPEAP
jgi:adenosylcobinamide kinase / adenosylcobinamide-phosphate guanylyltransferase